MKWIATLSLFLALSGGVLAAGTDDQYLDILGQILQADSLQESGHSDSAALKYLDARNALEKLHADHPTWNDAVVNYRLEYLSDKLKQLAQYVPASTNAPVVASANPTPQQQLAALQAQIDTLTAANLQLEQKVKEALSIQPAAVAPGELAKAQKQNVELQKQRDLLVVALAQEKAKVAPAPVPAPTAPASGKLADELAAAKKQADKEVAAANFETAEIKRQLAESQKKLADATTQVSSLKAGASSEDVKKLAGERDKLADELAALKTQSSKDASVAKSQIADLQRQMDTSKKMLADATAEVNKLKARPSSDDVKKITNERDNMADELASLRTQSSADAKTAKTQIADLQRQLDESKKMLADSTAQANASKSRPSTDEVNVLTSERDKLKKELAATNRELADREAHAASASAMASQDAAKLKQVEQQRDNLEKQVAALSRSTPNAGSGGGAALTEENKGLRAQLAVLEEAPIPLTAQEFAILDTKPATNAAAQIPAGSMEVTHKAHSVRELPPGAGGLMAEALRSASDGDYAIAEKKFLEVLAQDQDNVYVLVNLGDAQFAEGHLDDCEKNVHRALALDSEDPGALYLLGILRFRQDKLDDALDALSRSATINSTNSSTQNYLGCVLFAKGLPSKAETALRKALEIDPLYPDAHYNLALVYAKEQPPSMALAKWHYQRALTLGHAKNNDLEKLLGIAP